MTLVHASAVALDGQAALIRGPSGSGKSDLALRLLDAGWRLVADDQVALTVEAGVLRAAAHPRLAGRLEVRGIGIVRVPHLGEAPVVLVVDLVAPAEVERLPEAAAVTIEGVSLPSIRLAPFEVSAAAKLKFALRAAGGSARAAAL
ncbi:MAG TPA: HPr kinase/phosphatase C-terminal domain-containing protein [Candidatus Cybelea sp.]|nr:HPr kinase/phosphatase C-terminal domain-containing protein [Candidatus Cybelea sp.]